MAQKIKGVEILTTDGKILRHMAQIRSNDIIRVVNQILRCHRIDQVHNRAGADQGQSEPANAFDHRVGPFEKYADLKKLMDAVFVHCCLGKAVTTEGAAATPGSLSSAREPISTRRRTGLSFSD